MEMQKFKIPAYKSSFFNRNKLGVLFSIFFPVFSLLLGFPFNYQQDPNRGIGYIVYGVVTLSLVSVLNNALMEKIGVSIIIAQIKRWFIIQLLFTMLCVFIIITFIGFNIPHQYRLPSVSIVWFRIMIASVSILLIQYVQVFNTAHREEAVKKIQLERDQYMLKIQLIKQQLNPHFLFNSLGILQSMIEEKDESLEQYVLQLSTIYRRALILENQDWVSVEEELEGIHLYLEMLKTKFGDRLQVEVKICPKEIGHYHIPSWAFQILLENCVIHNISSIERPLCIRIIQTSPDHIAIINNILPKVENRVSAGIGHRYIQNQYDAIGLPDGIMQEKSELEYAVTLKLVSGMS